MNDSRFYSELAPLNPDNLPSPTEDELMDCFFSGGAFSSFFEYHPNVCIVACFGTHMYDIQSRNIPLDSRADFCSSFRADICSLGIFWSSPPMRDSDKYGFHPNTRKGTRVYRPSPNNLNKELWFEHGLCGGGGGGWSEGF